MWLMAGASSEQVVRDVDPRLGFRVFDKPTSDFRIVSRMEGWPTRYDGLLFLFLGLKC